jgi:hypothetical protein
VTAIVLAARDRVYLAAPGVLVAERERMPITVNTAKTRGAHFRIRAELKNWRTWAAEAAVGVQSLTPPVTVHVEHLRISGSGAPDHGSPYFAQKGLLDGLVDAGVLPDDGQKFVHRLIFESMQIVGWHGLRVTLTEVPA